MTVDLNVYLTDAGIPLEKTLVMRHTPTERSLLRRLSNWADSNPPMYNNYQSNQNPIQEKQLTLATHLASFIGVKTGEALFVGIYKPRFPGFPGRPFCRGTRATMGRPRPRLKIVKGTLARCVTARLMSPLMREDLAQEQPGALAFW